jgi:uncharacterized protein YndB with AHSA1/START domain
MSVTAVYKDANSLTLTVEAEFDATPERVWQLWSDPRKLERWWGPPTYPATVDSHDFREGGRVAYHMTGPQGDQSRGYWEIVEIDPPRRLVLSNGLADNAGKPDPAFPITGMHVWIEPIDARRTQMKLVSSFPTVEGMDQMLQLGMEEGLREAVGQIDAILDEDKVAAR